MFNLTLETTDKNRMGDVFNAYQEALDTTSIKEMIESLKANIGDSEIGRGSNHIWINDTKTQKRIAIISNIGQ